MDILNRCGKWLVSSLVFLAVDATAVYISTDGMGDVLLYPFYSIQGGQDTYISVTNHTQTYKALRVRFREGANNKEVLSFNLYLGPHDHWAGAVTLGTSGGVRLVTIDKSCVYPAMPAGGFVFSSIATETERQGMVEIIEMGVLDDGESHSVEGPFYATAGLSGVILLSSIFTTSEQQSFTGPGISGCDVIHQAWASLWGGMALPENSQPQADASRNIGPTTGGLSGYGVVVNVAEGTNASYDATALNNFFLNRFLHTHPGNAAPSLADADPVAYLLELTNRKIEFEQGIDAVSFLLMRESITNDIVLDRDIGASTDWVISFPTRQFYQPTGISHEDNNRMFQAFAFDTRYRISLTNRHGRSPYSVYYVCGISFMGCWEYLNQDALDYLKRTPSAVLPEGVNILAFGETSVFPGAVPVDLVISEPPPYVQGIDWIVDSFDQENVVTSVHFSGLQNDSKLSGRVGTTNVSLYGLPVLGFAVQKYVNGNVNGVLANYTGLVQHKYNRAMDFE